MDVHAHTHTPRKKWTHYFWEFLMLFLAVFCGFLAENQREHMIEHQRAKEFASLMYEELKKDTSYFRKGSEKFKMIKSHQDSLGLLLKPGVEKINNYDLIKHWINSIWGMNFTPQHATYEQMKNSGSLRYIKNIKLINSLQEYYTTTLPSITHYHHVQSELTETRMVPFLEDHINYQEADFFTGKINTRNPEVFDWNKRTAIKLYNMIALLKDQNEWLNKLYDSAGAKAVVVMQLLQKQYHLK